MYSSKCLGHHWVMGLNLESIIMPGKEYRVKLSPQERAELKGLVSRGRSAA